MRGGVWVAEVWMSARPVATGHAARSGKWTQLPGDGDASIQGQYAHRGNETMTSFFDTGWSFRRAGIALAAGVSLFAMAGAAHATPVVTLKTAVGKWTSVSPTNTVGLTGLDTSSVRWGTPTSGSQSGYDFSTSAPEGPHGVETEFNMG